MYLTRRSDICSDRKEIYVVHTRGMSKLNQHTRTPGGCLNRTCTPAHPDLNNYYLEERYRRLSQGVQIQMNGCIYVRVCRCSGPGVRVSKSGCLSRVYGCLSVQVSEPGSTGVIESGCAGVQILSNTIYIHYVIYVTCT
jgi:hypothetical protein